MVRNSHKSFSLFLAFILALSCLSGFFGSVSFAVPRVENELILDTDPENGYEGKYVIAYNPSLNTTEGLTTGIISDQMKSISHSNSSKDEFLDEPYIVNFNQRVSAASVKESMNNKPMLFSQDSEYVETLEYNQGDIRTFLIYAHLDDFAVTPVDFTLAAKGEHCYIWIINDEEYSLTDSEASLMASEYDEKIYANMRDSFGEYIDPEESGMLNILVYDIQDGFGITTNGYTCGYFNYEDLYFEDTFGNNAAMIHIDTYPTIHWRDEYNIQEAYSTIVHELQHLINFSQYLVNPNSPESESSVMDTWLNECCSLAAEELVYPQSVASLRLSKLTNSDNFYAEGRSVYAWNDDVLNYAMMYLFGQYIRLQTGSYKAFKNMLDVYANDASPNEAKAVEAAVLNSVLDGLTLSEITLAFRIAMIANETKAYNGIYGFCGEAIYDQLPEMTYSSSITPKIYGGGAIVFETADGVFYPAKNASKNLQYVGINFASLLPTASPEATIEPTIEATLDPTLDPNLTASPTPDSTPPVDTNKLLAYVLADKETVFPNGTLELALVTAPSFDAELDAFNFGINIDTQLFKIENVTLKDEFDSLLNCNVSDGIVSFSLKENEKMPLFGYQTSELATIELKAKTEIESTLNASFTVESASFASSNSTEIEISAITPTVQIAVPLIPDSKYIPDYESLSLKVIWGTTVDKIIESCPNTISVSAFKDGVEMENDEKIGTNTVIVFGTENNYSESFTAVLLGDNNCDASINSRDIAILQREIVEGDASIETSGVYLYKAFDIHEDSVINSRDLSALQRLVANGPDLLNNISEKASIKATSPVVSISTSKEVVAPGETITVTVSFDPLYVTNLSVMELIIPINMDVFSFVQDSAQFYLEKGDNTIGDAIFLSAKNQFFCNYVDVSKPINYKATKICSFMLTAKQNIDNAAASFELSDTSFMCDANLNDIAYTSRGTTVTVSTAQGLMLVGGSSYKIDAVNKYLTNVPGSTTVSTVKSNFTASGTLTIEKSDGTVLGNDSKVATGSEIKLYAGSSLLDKLTIIIQGDVTGDGLVNSRDIATLQRHVTGAVLLEGVFFNAGDMNNDLKINSRDLASLQRLIAS